MNLSTILFLTITTISGTVVLGIGLANLPQPSTSYIQGSGDSAETIAQKNKEIILNSYEFKLTMIGTGLLVLSLVTFFIQKYRDENKRVAAEEQMELERVKQEKELAKKQQTTTQKPHVEKPAVQSPVQQLIAKSAELDSPYTKESPPTQLKVKPLIFNPQSVKNAVLHIQRNNQPRSILKNSGNHSLVRNYPNTPYNTGYNRPYYPRPFNTLYQGYNRPVIEYVKY